MLSFVEYLAEATKNNSGKIKKEQQMGFIVTTLAAVMAKMMAQMTSCISKMYIKS